MKFNFSNLFIIFFTLFNTHNKENDLMPNPITYRCNELNKTIGELHDKLFGNSDGIFDKYSTLIQFVFNMCFDSPIFESDTIVLLFMINRNFRITKYFPLHFAYVGIISDFYHAKIINLDQYNEIFMSNTYWKDVFMDFETNYEDNLIIDGIVCYVNEQWKRESDEIFNDAQLLLENAY